MNQSLNRPAYVVQERRPIYVSPIRAYAEVFPGEMRGILQEATEIPDANILGIVVQGRVRNR